MTGQNDNLKSSESAGDVRDGITAGQGSAGENRGRYCMNRFLQKGDVIYADRGLYQHYSIYDSDNRVIHFSPDKGVEISAENARIRKTTLAEFLKGDGLHVDRTIRTHFPPGEVVRRARSLAGKLRGEYNLLFFNCEHFARWYATGEMESEQIRWGAAIVGALAVTTVALTAALIEKVIRDEEEDEQT
jgi:hypothetical protein